MLVNACPLNTDVTLDTPSVKIVCLGNPVLFRQTVFIHCRPTVRASRHLFRCSCLPSGSLHPQLAPHTTAKRSGRTLSSTRTTRCAIRHYSYTKTHPPLQPVPIPSYLIAIASGNVRYRAFPDAHGQEWSAGTWAEPEFIDAAFWEFSEHTCKWVMFACLALKECSHDCFSLDMSGLLRVLLSRTGLACMTCWFFLRLSRTVAWQVNSNDCLARSGLNELSQENACLTFLTPSVSV